MNRDDKKLKVFPLLTEKEIKKKIKQLAEEISRDFKGQEVILLGILKGSFVFMADIIREMKIPLKCEFIKISSYSGYHQKKIKLQLLNSLSLKGKNVIVLEDIVDTGNTLDEILKRLRRDKPRCLRVCCLLVKEKERKKDIKVDYTGFKIPDKFVVGFGLDYKENFRNLKYIGYIE